MEEEQRNTEAEETQEDTNVGVGVEPEQVVAGGGRLSAGG